MDGWLRSLRPPSISPFLSPLLRCRDIYNPCKQRAPIYIYIWYISQGALRFASIWGLTLGILKIVSGNTACCADQLSIGPYSCSADLLSRANSDWFISVLGWPTLTCLTYFSCIQKKLRLSPLLRRIFMDGYWSLWMVTNRSSGVREFCRVV